MYKASSVLILLFFSLIAHAQVALISYPEEEDTVTCSSFVYFLFEDSEGDEMYVDFGDGEDETLDIDDEEVEHDFPGNGYYEVMFVASDGGQTDTTWRYLHIIDRPDADFIFNYINDSCYKLTGTDVEFTNVSTPDPLISDVYYI